MVAGCRIDIRLGPLSVAQGSDGRDHAPALAAAPRYTRQDLCLLCGIAHLVGAELRLLDLENEQLELLGEMETRKLVERSKGILERELGLSEPEPTRPCSIKVRQRSAR